MALGREVGEESRFATRGCLDSESLAEDNRAEAAKAVRTLVTSGVW